MVISFHNIRDVSPQSRMYSTTFRLPTAVAYASSEKISIYEEFKEAEPNKR
jgi:hypothetical protein